MPLGTRVWSLGKLLLLAGTLLATFFVFFGLSMRAALRTREVKVPALVGQTVGDATQALNELGLPLRVDDNRRSDEKIPGGRIMQQDPAPGSPPPRPDGSRLGQRGTARRDDSAAGRPDRAHGAHPPGTGRPRGWLGLRVPLAATTLPTRSCRRTHSPHRAHRRWRLLVNRGEAAATFVMPDVIGMEGERAAGALRRAAFAWPIVGSQPYPGVPPAPSSASSRRRASRWPRRRDLARGQPMNAPSRSRPPSCRRTSRTWAATSPRLNREART